MSRRALTAAAVCLLGLPLAACGAGSSATDPSASAGPSTPPPAEHLVTVPSSTGPAALPPSGKGWTMADIPVFPPAPPPQPIALPKTGGVPYLSRIPTQQPVAFLTIDDGYLKVPEAPQLLAAAGIPVTL